MLEKEDVFSRFLAGSIKLMSSELQEHFLYTARDDVFTVSA